MNGTERQREVKETGEGNSGGYETAHSLHTADKQNHAVQIPCLKNQMGILDRDIAWLPCNTGYGYRIDYVKSGSSLDILGESTGL